MELPGRCGDWLDTATVTVQGSRSGSTRRARGGDFYLATSGDFLMATCGDFLMATDSLQMPRGSAGGVNTGASSPAVDGICGSVRVNVNCVHSQIRRLLASGDRGQVPCRLIALPVVARLSFLIVLTLSWRWCDDAGDHALSVAMKKSPLVARFESPVVAI